TECGCQPVAATIAAMVVPLAWRSNLSTDSCFDVDSLFDPSGAVRVVLFRLGFAVPTADRRRAFVALLPSECFAERLGFDFLRTAIESSCLRGTTSRAATDSSPASGRAGTERPSTLVQLSRVSSSASNQGLLPPRFAAQYRSNRL